MRYEIQGENMQSIEVHLEQGESVYTEAGGMAWMKGDIGMETNTRGGLMAGLGRALAGESLFLTTYSCNGPEATIVFTPEAPGKVLDIQLESGQSMICQKDAFMFAEDSVQLEMHFRKRLGAGLFGGEGFILQKVTGPGRFFAEVPGEARQYTLEAGEQLRVDPGHIAMFDPTVDHDISRVKGVKNILFGGEGLFLATLTGPGRVWLQTMPLSNLAAKIASMIPSKG
jgi:uncharacterized protein (TIGR00266 family)